MQDHAITLQFRNCLTSSTNCSDLNFNLQRLKNVRTGQDRNDRISLTSETGGALIEDANRRRYSLSIAAFGSFFKMQVLGN